MNAERMHAVAYEVHKDFRNLDLAKKLQKLASQLQHNTQNPKSPPQDIAPTIEELSETLEASLTNHFSSTWLEIVEEIGGTKFLAKNLKSHLALIFKRNVTSGIQLQEIKLIQESLNPYMGSINSLCNSMENLGVQRELMGAGECEVGIVVPRLAVHNALENFGRELVQLHKMLGVFNEIATDSRESFKIKTISSSELTIFVEMAMKSAACLAFAIERILALYKNMLEIKKLENEMDKRNIPQDAISSVRRHSEGFVDDGIEQLSEDLLAKYHASSNKGRKNELSNELRVGLKKLAKRIDSGYVLDIRIEPYFGEDIVEEDSNVVEIDSIQTTIRNIEYPSAIDKSVLNLPDIDE